MNKLVKEIEKLSNDIEDAISSESDNGDNKKEDKKRVLSIQILKETKREMENEKVIFDKEDLNITGKEVIREFPKIKLELLSDFMTEIAGKMAETQTKNDKETIIVTGNKVINSKRDYWLDK